jgi:hypothetical protein
MKDRMLNESHNIHIELNRWNSGLVLVENYELVLKNKEDKKYLFTKSLK